MVVGVVALAFHTEVAPHLVFKWIGFTVITGIVFGDTMRLNRRWWRERRFWLLLGTFFAIQCGVGLVVLGMVAKVPAMVWVIFMPLDYVALGAYLSYFLEWVAARIATSGAGFRSLGS
jgi:hypothetical protein